MGRLGCIDMLSVGEQVGKYQILQSLGGGNFGKVYRVRDHALGREVALKIIPTTDADSVKALVEAQAQNLCKHDNCVHVASADVFDVQGELSVLIEMEYLPNGSLQAKLSEAFLSCSDGVRHICQVLYALEFAHSKGILHRDVKPGNILIGSPHTKLSDFGIAFDVRRPNAGYNIAYSPHASPQVALGNVPKVTDDVFSAGMTLFRLVNNYADWDGVRTSLPDWRASVREGSLVNDIGFEEFIPKPVRRVIKLACHPDERKRYQSCLEFRQALEKLRFKNSWERDALGNWYCATETVSVEGVNVQHRVNGRRRLSNCKTLADADSARKFAASLIVSSILV